MFKSREDREWEKEVFGTKGLIFGKRGTAKRYIMREKLLTIGNDVVITDEHGNKVFQVLEKIISVRKAVVFEDMNGKCLCQIQERMMRVQDTAAIVDAEGNVIAEVKKKMFTPLVDRWYIKVGEGPDLEVDGNILDYEYEFKEGTRKVAQVSRKFVSVRDSYGIDIAPGQDDIYILAAVAALENMARLVKK